MLKQQEGVISKAGETLLCLLLLLPSFFINNADSHDWGGDFALYITQAQNIVEGIPASENQYIYNPECPGLGPPSYPIGFSLMLAPVIAVTGNSMPHLIDYMALIFILFGYLMFTFLKPRIGLFGALLSVLLLVYHPLMLGFKREVMSDIPFAVFVLATFYFASRKSWILVGVSVAFATAVRSAGISLMVASAALAIIELFRNREFTFRAVISSPLVRSTVIGVVVFILISEFLFPGKANSGYVSFIQSHEFGNVIVGNAELYWQLLRSFFFTESASAFLSVCMVALALLMLAGWLKKVVKKPGLEDLWFPIYIMVLLLYPYRGGALRFIIPVLPLLFYYIYHALEFNLTTKRLAMAFLVLPIILNFPKTMEFTSNWPKNLAGPQSETSTELFGHIVSETNQSESFLFLKPRVLALYTDRACMSNERYQPVHSIKAQLDSVGIDYVLACNTVWNPGVDSLLTKYPENFNLKFENSDFQLYRYISETE